MLYPPYGMASQLKIKNQLKLLSWIPTFILDNTYIKMECQVPQTKITYIVLGQIAWFTQPSLKNGEGGEGAGRVLWFVGREASPSLSVTIYRHKYINYLIICYHKNIEKRGG